MKVVEDMSARSLAQLAVDRDAEPQGKSFKSASDVLVAAVPSETLAAYTTLIGIVLAADIGSTYSIFRWSAYGVFVALAVLAPLALYRHKVTAITIEHRPLPVWECFTAGLAAAAWGLVMPGSPLDIVLTGNALVFTTVAIVLGAATVIGFLTPVLGTANSRNSGRPSDKSTAPRSAHAGAAASNGAKAGTKHH